ncbi:MAG TPA: hypothetical protein DGG95_16120 [Cytophagales bacterium]|nr:hypothetical protein [Cytophagales bacterium]
MSSLKNKFIYEAYSLILKIRKLTELNQPQLKKSRSHFFNKQAKMLIVTSIIIGILLVSSFAFLQKKGDSKSTFPQSTDMPDTTPSTTIDPTATPIVKGDTGSSKSLPITFPSYAPLQPTPVPTPKPPGVIETAQEINATIWRSIAQNAWNYYQPGVGVNEDNGLPAIPFTDWDLGVYIQALIDASKIGLIDNGTDWDFVARISKIMTFLQTRELNTNGYPFWFYQPDGNNFHEISDTAKVPVDCVDTGRLFVALNNLRTYDSRYNENISKIVYNRSNYAALVPSINSGSYSEVSIYAYYVDSGFASFWPELSGAPKRIMDNIFNSGNITTNENATLPLSAITGDPLYCSIFELNNNDSRLLALGKEVYLAHEAYFNATGNYRAFGEGPSNSKSYQWGWEWVVLPDNRTWVSLNSNDQNMDAPPVIYTKIAFSFLALYNTPFAINMSVYLERNLPEPYWGYYDGVDEAGNSLQRGDSLTNSLILDAAVYFLKHNPE